MLDNIYFIQRSDGRYFKGFRAIYTPHKQWEPTWSNGLAVPRNLYDVKAALDILTNDHGITDIGIVSIQPYLEG